MNEETATVFACEACHKKFISKTSCNRHEPQCRELQEKRRVEAAARTAEVERLNAIKNRIRLTCDDLTQLGQMIADYVVEHIGGIMTVISCDPVGVYNDYRGDYVHVGVSSLWINRPDRADRPGTRAGIEDIFSQYGRVRLPISGIEVINWNTSPQPDVFVYKLRVNIANFPLLKEKMDIYAALTEKANIRVAEGHRLSEVHRQYVENMCVCNAERIELEKQLTDVVLEVDRLVARRAELNQLLAANKKSVSDAAWEEHKDILTPGPEFDYDTDTYHNVKSSLGIR